MKKELFIFILLLSLGIIGWFLPTVWSENLKLETNEPEPENMTEAEVFLEQLPSPNASLDLLENITPEKQEEYNLLFEETLPETNPTKGEVFFDEDEDTSKESLFSEHLLDPKTFYQAQELYNTNCTGCHARIEPQKYTLEQWPAFIARMGPEASLNQEQLDLIYAYIMTAQLSPELETPNN